MDAETSQMRQRPLPEKGEPRCFVKSRSGPEEQGDEGRELARSEVPMPIRYRDERLFVGLPGGKRLTQHYY